MNIPAQIFFGKCGVMPWNSPSYVKVLCVNDKNVHFPLSSEESFNVNLVKLVDNTVQVLFHMADFLMYLYCQLRGGY